jgi:hypothetical protein
MVRTKKPHNGNQLVHSIVDNIRIVNGRIVVFNDDTAPLLHVLSELPNFSNYMRAFDFDYSIRQELVPGIGDALPKDFSGCLKDALDDDNVSQISTAAVNLINSLPWKYDVFVELPGCVNVQACKCYISEGLDLQFSISKELWFEGYRQDADQSYLDDERVYMKIGARGYSSFGSSLTISQVLSQVKYLLFLCRVFAVAKVDHFNFFPSSATSEMIIVRRDDESQVQRVFLHGHIAKCLRHVKMNFEDLKVIKEGPTLFGTEVPAATAEEKSSALSTRFYTTGRIFSLFNDTKVQKDVE